MDLPKKKYQIIYADPPWAWSKKPLVNRGAARTVEKEYATMQPEEITNLPIKDIAEENSILFLWVTFPKLPEALKVIEAWGFSYKTVGFVWVKMNKKKDTPFYGMGFYTRSNAEICLIATKGSLSRVSASVFQLIFSKVGVHSEKPSITRDKIVELMGAKSRIELFARQKTEGWDAWGNEVPDNPIPPAAEKQAI